MHYFTVFDTNILLSALLSTSSNPFKCLALARIGQVESVTCREILDEFAEKLRVKFKFSEEMIRSVVEEVCRFSRLVDIFGMLRAVPDDPDDDMVVECAVVGNATHIVTGDKHLLALTAYQGIVILGAADFVRLFLST